MKTTLLMACALAALTLFSTNARPDVEAAPNTPDVPAGTYRLDPAHASLIFRVDHLGFSRYTAPIVNGMMSVSESL